MFANSWSDTHRDYSDFLPYSPQFDNVNQQKRASQHKETKMCVPEAVFSATSLFTSGAHEFVSVFLYLLTRHSHLPNCLVIAFVLPTPFTEPLVFTKLKERRHRGSLRARKTDFSRHSYATAQTVATSFLQDTKLG